MLGRSISIASAGIGVVNEVLCKFCIKNNMSFMKKLAVFSRSSSRTSFATLSPTLSTLAARPSLPWTLFTPSRGRAGPSTVSAVRELPISALRRGLGFLIVSVNFAVDIMQRFFSCSLRFNDCSLSRSYENF